MAKKMLSLLLALSMTAAIFAGCGNSEGEVEEAPAVSEEAAEESEEAEELEPVELKWWVVKDANSEGEDEVEEAVNTYLAEVLPNTTVDISFFTIGDQNEKLDKALASGEPIDITWFGWMHNQETMVQLGAMTELDDLLAEYGQGVVDTLGQNVIDMHRASDGNAYFLPCWQGLGSARYAVFIPQKFVDVMGEEWAAEFQAALNEAHDAVETDYEARRVGIDKLEELLIKLEEEGVANGGMSLREFAYLYGNKSDVKGLGGDLDICADIARVSLVDDTYYIEGEYAENGFCYNVNKTIADWYSKGYFREDAASFDWIANADVDSWGNLSEDEWFVGLANDAYSDSRAAQLSATNGVELEGFMIQPNVSLNNGFATGMFIPSTSENPERAMMLLDIIYTDPTIHRLLSYGIEGVDYTLDDQDVRTTVEGSEYVGCYNWTVGTCEHSLPGSEAEIGYYEGLKAAEETAEESIVLGFSFVHTDETTLAKSNIDAAVAQYIGPSNQIRPTDEYWSDLRQAALDNGYEEYFNEMVEQFTAYAEANGKKVEVIGY